MQPVYVTKNLTAAASTGIGTFSSAATSVTFSTVDLGTGRRILVWDTSAMGATVTITGLGETLNPISEAVLTSTVVATAQAGTATVQDFRAITAVSVSAGVPSTAAYLGTNTQGGTPWYVVDTTRNPINLSFAIDVTSPSTITIASFEYSGDYPSYDPNTKTWVGANPTVGPKPTISSLGSSVTVDTIGSITAPIAAWRVTITSTSSAAGSVAASVIQAG